MGDWHFSNWVRLVVFTFDRITEFPRNQAAPLVGRESARAVPTIESSIMLVGSSVTVDDRHRDPFIQKSIDPIIQYLSVKYLCNTLKYDRSDLKENGTIPF
jgi:hypothetical protein